MATMADAVTYTDIPEGVAAVAGYIDGRVSAWPAEGWAHFAGTPGLRVTVLADPDAECFDSEPGNATVTAVASAVAKRTAQGLPSVVYTDESNEPGLSKALNARGQLWHPVSEWPAAGPYLWATVGNAGAGATAPWAPVEPVAVQNRWLGTYDLSTLSGDWLPPVLGGVQPAPEPAPDPPPAPTSGPTYQLASDTDTKVPGGVVYVPTPTLDDARNALTAGHPVYFWTTVTDKPVAATSLADLNEVEHTGDTAYPQYVTYTASTLR